MANLKLDVAKMNEIVDKTIKAISDSKNEIYDIAESSRKECERLEQELRNLREQVIKVIDKVEFLETELKESKRKLMLINKNFSKYTQDELRKAYDKADSLRIELAVKREQEANFIRRRNELEVRIKEANKIVEKADNLVSHVGTAMDFLTGDLKELSVQLEDVQQRKYVGYRIIKAQEDERKRVARDIHDGPAQSMSNVVLKAEICERLIDVDVDKSKKELHSLKSIVRESLQDVRKIIYNLRPMSLDDLGLIPTLQRYIMTFEEETGIITSFRTIGIYDDIRSEISLTVFRIVQEALNNIKKHSNAQNVAVNMEFTNGVFNLYIYDDGQGFNVKDLKVSSEDKSSGFGLFSMRERIDLLNGDIKINSEPNKGTRLNITIPLENKEEELNG